jgi:phage terminase Nu1 subunit (DNA packaging protein)
MARTKTKLMPPAKLRGWKQIAEFMGLPESTVQRWAREGMPVTRAGRNVTAVPEEMNRWFDRNTGQRQDVHIATDTTDLAADLKKSLAQVKATPPKKSARTRGKR